MLPWPPGPQDAPRGHEETTSPSPPTAHCSQSKHPHRHLRMAPIQPAHSPEALGMWLALICKVSWEASACPSHGAPGKAGWGLTAPLPPRWLPPLSHCAHAPAIWMPRQRFLCDPVRDLGLAQLSAPRLKPFALAHLYRAQLWGLLRQALCTCHRI